MLLASTRNGGAVTLTTITDLLYFSLSEAMREQLGIRRYPDHDKGFEAAYTTVRHIIRPSPLPTP
jgi:hypothetical protein